MRERAERNKSEGDRSQIMQGFEGHQKKLLFLSCAVARHRREGQGYKRILLAAVCRENWRRAIAFIGRLS